MYLRFGSIPVVVASSPAMARLILQTHGQIFAWRAQPAVPMYLYGCKDVLFSQPGPYWKLIRQICVTDLFGSKRLEACRPMIVDEVRAMLCDIADAPDKVHVRTKLYAATSTIISRMAIGKRLEEVATQSQADPSYNIVSLLLEVIHLLGLFNVGDYIPWLAWMDLQGCARKSKALSQKLQRVWQEVIDARRSERHHRGHITSQEVDFLDVLLSAADRNDAQISDHNIQSILSDIYGGGIDTSTISIEWALGELITHPLIMKRVQEELDAVVGSSRLVHESDIRQMPYLRAVVKETMRLHPVLPLLVPHMASQQCQVSGFDIPLNAQAYINIWAIGRDPTIWDRPLEFCPERFLDSNIDVRGQHFELLPFGSGRRACPGMILGLNNVQVMLANLIHVFNWTVEDSLSLTEKFGIVLTLADPIIGKASLRVPKHILKAENDVK
ncbi:hypothetical protein GOP47_0017339 [Adiantum capillus-veneris]|uniref:Cytochrome P450 n=1 Tax=Adiantum capillus-veneris TaxID=13818 RepID=A0A9D4UGE7_ADICA|nr:hypothetical protein GOP47_0017339 [Adiantum capillus-veneris]